LIDKYCLLGEDVSNSPSPSMMNAAFAAVGIDASYEAISVAREEFRGRFLALREAVKGFNLTMPYKSEVLPLLDSLDEVSLRIGAANVVKRSGSRLTGYNSDVSGITAPLREHGKARIDSALLLGAGGGARAFCEAMDQLGCEQVTVAVRKMERGERFAAEMARIFPRIEFGAVAIEEIGPRKADLLFNATPLGSTGHPLPDQVKRVIYGQMTVFDAVYRPMKTELLRIAEERGSPTIQGYEMLLNQGTLAFEIWTGRMAPKDSMRRALLESLGARS
jgi:shikimate dehydrogenase